MKLIVFRNISLTTILTITALCGLTVSANASESFEPLIEQRQKGFKKMGGAMKAIKLALKSGELGTEEVTTAAQTLKATSTDIANWFPAGSGSEAGVETDALSYIWKNPEKFSASTEKLIIESQKLAELSGSTDSSALMAQLKAVKNTCSGCHKSFRAD